MVFGRRKSGQVADNNEDKAQTKSQDEIEVRRRNRLSKPLTSNKSSSNLALLAVQDSNVASRNVSVEAINTPLSPPPISPQLSEAEKRQQIKAHLFDSNVEPEKKVSKRASWIAVAALVNRFEASPNSSQLSLSAPKQKGSGSGLFSSLRSSGSKRPALSNDNSMDRTVTLNNEQPANSSSVSLDDTPEPVFPTSRRASFQPGVATRKFSGVESIQELDESARSQTQKRDAITEESGGESDAMSFSEGDDDEWFPPPPETRSETPQSLDYTHLGGLRLGSLQVVNGRASPATSVAASMASRHLLAQMTAQRGRDTSSEYGDSEAGDGPPYMLKSTSRTPQTHSREVSWYSQRPSKLHQVEIYELPSRMVQESAAIDVAAAMAAEYIAELPSSPYKLQKRTSTSSLRQERFKQAPAIAELSSSHSSHSLRKSPSLETISHRSSSPVPSLQSSTGSILRTTTKRTEIDDALFDDETLGPSRASPVPILEDNFNAEPDRTSIDSFHSWHSSPKPQFARTEAFESAVEFQSYPSPQKAAHQSPKRKPLPVSSPMFQLREASPERRTQRLELLTALVQSDSGYSSNNSIRSSSWERKSIMDQRSSRSPERPQQQSQLPPEQPKPFAKLHKPILKTRKTAPAVPSFSELRPAPPSSTASVISNTSKGETEKPKPRKLQKRNVFGKKKQKELFVQSVASVDDLSIPAIPAEIQANLQIRTRHVPELEKTYRTNSHIKSQPSVSAIELPKVDLRFPSPDPEPALTSQLKPKRRSWLPGVSEKPKPKHTSMISERDAKMMIQDFGSVNRYLGGNPYDLAREGGPRVGKKSHPLSPFNVSTQPQQPRSTFDAQTAAEIARLRSSSIKERDAWNERRGSFNDRGGIPGKKIRPASFRADAPPVPALPSADALYRRLSGMHPQAAPPPPPPPPHSPRPLYIEPQDVVEETELAPPPPSHSPRPMDVDEPGDPWAAQAAVWKVRRNGADQTFKRASYHEEFSHQQPSADPLYPDIPPRGSPSAYQAQRSYSHQPDAYDDHGHLSGARYDQYHGLQYQYQAHQSPQVHQPHHHQQLRQPPRLSKTQRLPQTQFQTQAYDSSIDGFNIRALPTPRGPRRSPAPSIRSFRSNVSSMAEDIHPELSDDATRPHPPPEFGRYSGGLQFGYERQNGGFGGSAGTRSVSGKADLAHKGVKLREGFGVDLGDVPVMIGAR